MAAQIVPIHRTNADSSSTSTTDKNNIWFNAFNFAPGQDEHIRWLSRPNQELIRGKHSQDAEKFRITFDVENFQPDQIKIFIQNRKLTISGVYEEHSEGRFMQKQFERSFDIPANADVDSMASFITAAHMLVVEIPLHASAQVDHLKLDSNSLNNQRRLSFSLNKFNTSGDQGSVSTTSNNQGSLATPGQQVRRTSITKTTTTTTSGSSNLPAEAAELLRSADTTTGSTTQTYSTHSTERHSSNTGNQQVATHQPDTPSSSSTTTSSNKQTTSTNSDLANLPVDIPPELLASGGTITIQRRKVSVTSGGDGHADQPVSVPITRSNDTHSTSSTTSNNSELNTTNNTSSNTLNQQQTNTSERRGSKTISSSNHSHMYTLEEFLQNKTWNPTLVDGSGGKKILHMRLQMKPGTTLDQMKISLNGHDLRVEVDNKVSTDGGRSASEHSYRQVTLFPSCEIDQLKTELKDDGFLHIQVPMTL